jgi:dTDP-4-dehydrorhamnose 3,5-epimerase
MKITKTPLADLLLLEPQVYEDPRGYFIESYQQAWFDTHVAPTAFIQDNESKSSRGVLRGLHFQSGAFAQAKLVRVLQGEVLDVVVDLRPNSPSFGQHFKVILNDDNKKQVFIPRGFAHGFLTLSETAVFAYKVDNHYSKAHEGGIAYNDPDLAIDWGLTATEILISEKDAELPTLQQWKALTSNQQDA